MNLLIIAIFSELTITIKVECGFVFIVGIELDAGVLFPSGIGEHADGEGVTFTGIDGLIQSFDDAKAAADI